ncbi:ATP-binding protein [Pseudozobellia sp. WGM2]|uniref:sensor histidine kinase n=1 Tax=Pseudozobellia sp. WGM2 TaxID=2787625 RepID=UPI001ADF60A8|nr:GAF domain-containing sensor histidine kinase [Pseudozobellia sp. WGM2]
MKYPEDHAEEEERVKALKSYKILDTLPEDDYENLTKIAAEICGTSISLVSLIDDHRQWFKSNHGLKVKETSKDYAFCAHAINDSNDGDAFIIEDARKDVRFADNPLVVGDPNVIFYAGVPLVTPSGLPLGTLCVIDHKSKSLTDSQIETLKILSKQVMNLLELRKSKKQLESTVEILKKNNAELERFARVAAHDLKSPLNNIWSLSGFLKEEFKGHMTPRGEDIILHIRNSSETLRKFIDGLLVFSTSTSVLHEHHEDVVLDDLHQNLAELFVSVENSQITINSELTSIKVNRTALEQILINLIANAIKHNDKDTIDINLVVGQSDTHYRISVADNGPGIAIKDQEKIFELFQKLEENDRFGEVSTGIGLATVKRTVNNLGGEITLISKMGKGSKFIFTIEK